MRAPPLRSSLLLVALIGLTPSSAEAQAVEGEATAAVIEVEGALDDFQARAVKASIKEALSRKPRYLIVRIDSPGGTIKAADAIATALVRARDAEVQTIAFVDKDALSGGAMVAIACDRIIMARGARLGDVLPIEVRQNILGQIKDVSVAEKLISPMRSSLLGYAGDKEYPREVLAAMVDPQHQGLVRYTTSEGGKSRVRYMSLERFENLSSRELASISGDEVLARPGQLLTLTGEQARACGMAWAIDLNSVDAVCAALASEAHLKSVEAYRPSGLWWVGFLRLCTQPIVRIGLFVAGAVFLVIGLTIPGTGAPEVFSVLCFALGLGASYAVGLSGFAEIGLFLLGVGLLAIEVFVIPGFGFTGVAGILMILASFLLSLQRFVLPTTDAEWDLFAHNIFATGSAFVLSVAAVGVAMRFLPKSSLLRGLILSSRQPSGTEAAIAGTDQSAAALVGRVATVHTPLRPVGEILLAGEVIDAVSEERSIDPGTLVEIIGRSGFSVVVRPAPKGLTCEDDGLYSPRGEVSP